MSNKSLENKKRLLVKSAQKEKVEKKIKLENVNTTLLNSVVNSMDKKSDSFENLCKQKCITDKKSLQIYHDVAITGKVIEKFNYKLKNLDILSNFIQILN